GLTRSRKRVRAGLRTGVGPFDGDAALATPEGARGRSRFPEWGRGRPGAEPGRGLCQSPRPWMKWVETGIGRSPGSIRILGWSPAGEVAAPWSTRGAPGRGPVDSCPTGPRLPGGLAGFRSRGPPISLLRRNRTSASPTSERARPRRYGLEDGRGFPED